MRTEKKKNGAKNQDLGMTIVPQRKVVHLLLVGGVMVTRDARRFDLHMRMLLSEGRWFLIVL